MIYHAPTYQSALQLSFIPALIFIFSVLIFSTAPILAQASCPGALPSRMKVDQPGRVIARNGTNVRDAPSVNSPRAFGIPADATFFVIDGPVCADGFAWWEVQYGDGGPIGWTAEGNTTDYWLESLAPNLRQVTFEDVLFAYDRALASGAYGGYTGESRPSDTLFLPAGMGFGFQNYLMGDAAFLVLYPAKDYETRNPGSISGLEAALRDQQITASPDARWFPYTGIPAKIAGRVRYFEFQSGLAVRFLMYYPSPTPEAVTSRSFFYVFLGLTDDRQRFIQGFFPVSTYLFPDTPTPEDFDARSETAYEAYLADVVFAVDQADAASFDPQLRSLDTMLNTLQVTLSPSQEDWVAVGYEGVRFSLDPGLARTARGEAVAAGDNNAPYWQRTPAHVEFVFDGLPMSNEMPQLAIFPAQDYNLRFAGAMDELNAFLRANIDTAEPPQRLPITNARRVFSVQPQYLSFNNGGGVRFLAYFSDATEYITRTRGVTYVFLGITDDGSKFVQMMIPVEAKALPDERPTDFNYEQFVAGYSDYLINTRRDLNTETARNFTPRLDQLDALVRSLDVR